MNNLNNINKLNNINNIPKKEAPKLEQTGIKGENINIKADTVYIINNTNNFNKPIYNTSNYPVSNYNNFNYPPYYHNFINFYNLFSIGLYNSMFLYNPIFFNYFYTTSLFNPYFYCSLLPSYICLGLFNLLKCF
jgi:hypothetical protein